MPMNPTNCVGGIAPEWLCVPFQQPAKGKFFARRRSRSIRWYGLQWTTRLCPNWYCQQTRWY